MTYHICPCWTQKSYKHKKQKNFLFVWSSPSLFSLLRLRSTFYLGFTFSLSFFPFLYLIVSVMDAIRKQASKLREQVAKQQQVVLKRLGSLANDAIAVDESEQSCRQQLQSLYNSTRASKHFQRSIVRSVEGFVSISSKQMVIVRKLAEDCSNYGSENQSTNPVLSRAAICFGTSHNSIEKEREALLTTLADQVCEPLRAQINGAPLEDARHLTHRYDRLRHDMESQVAEVMRRRAKSRASSMSEESSAKLQTAEARLTELKSSIKALGQEATAAMLSVEDQQQQATFFRLLTMVNAERSYHQHALAILKRLQAEMILEKQPKEFPPVPVKEKRDIYTGVGWQDNKSKFSDGHEHVNCVDEVFVAKVIHQFDAQAEGELNLSLGDYVVVRQVAPNGWSLGECMSKAGWFPSAYVERQETAPADKIM